MQKKNRQAELYINGQSVGEVEIKGSAHAWDFGQFRPADAFSRFSPLFGAWAMLIHEDDQGARASRDTLEELRAAETAIDALKAELRWVDSQERTPLTHLTIDGHLIEWKHEARN